MLFHVLYLMRNGNVLNSCIYVPPDLHTSIIQDGSGANPYERAKNKREGWNKPPGKTFRWDVQAYRIEEILKNSHKPTQPSMRDNDYSIYPTGIGPSTNSMLKAHVTTGPPGFCLDPMIIISHSTTTVRSANADRLWRKKWRRQLGPKGVWNFQQMLAAAYKCWRRLELNATLKRSTNPGHLRLF